MPDQKKPVFDPLVAPGMSGDADDQVAAAQAFVLAHEPRVGNIGDPEKALDDEQLFALHDDIEYRHRLVEESGGSSDVWEGVVVSEAFNSDVQRWIIDWKARARSVEAVHVLESYEASAATRLGYKVYQRRLKLQGTWLRFWTWLRATS